MKIAIIIPARYGSTRFPGKPLAVIAGQSMLSRVVDLAREAAGDRASVTVATEDQRIVDHAAEIGVDCIVTSDACATGSDRALEAAAQMSDKPDFILNLQGDAPFTPLEAITAIMDAASGGHDVVTPVHRLSWEDLDQLRENKKVTPFSGTTAIIDSSGAAIWFSKNIIPAVRSEDRSQPLSPVYQHMGLYGYSYAALGKFCDLPQSYYEELEGLEQLRFLENGIAVQTVTVDAAGAQSGIDSPEDLARAEAILAS